MDRAEEVIRSRAVSEKANDYCSLYYDWDNEAERRAVIGTFKQGYYEGYKHAEKDLALTWEDIGFVHSCLEDIFKEIAKGQHDEWTVQDIYKEALRRFNEQRKK